MKQLHVVVFLIAFLPVSGVLAGDPKQESALLEAKLKNSHVAVQRQKDVVQKLVDQNLKIQSSDANRTNASSESMITNRIVQEAAKLELAREESRLATLVREHKVLLDTARSEAIIDSGRLLDRLAQYQLPEPSTGSVELDQKATAMLSQLANPRKSTSAVATEAKEALPANRRVTEASLASVAMKPKMEATSAATANHLQILSTLRESNSLVQGADGALKIRNSGGEWTLEIVQGRCNHCRSLGHYGGLDIYFHQCDGRFIAVIKR